MNIFFMDYGGRIGFIFTQLSNVETKSSTKKTQKTPKESLYIISCKISQYKIYTSGPKHVEQIRSHLSRSCGDISFRHIA